MAVRRKMGFSVNDLLLAEELKDAKILGGKEGLDRQIKGVTIIEAPDILNNVVSCCCRIKSNLFACSLSNLIGSSCDLCRGSLKS